MKQKVEKIKAVLSEASLGRLVQHIHKGDVLAFVSASRSDAMPNSVKSKLLNKYGYAENQLDLALQDNTKFRLEYNEVLASYNNKRYADLKNSLSYINKILKIGYYKVVGGYVETLKDGTKVKVEEKSVVLFAPKESAEDLLNIAKSLGVKYDQESIMFVEDGYAKWHYTAGVRKGDIEDVGKFHPRQVGDYYSKVAGRAISFANLTVESFEVLKHPSQLRIISKMQEKYNRLKGTNFSYFEEFLSKYKDEEILSVEDIANNIIQKSKAREISEKLSKLRGR